MMAYDAHLCFVQTHDTGWWKVPRPDLAPTRIGRRLRRRDLRARYRIPSGRR